MIQSKMLSNDVIEIYGGIQPSSNVYLLPSEKILIDLGCKLHSRAIIKELAEYGITPFNIKKIVFTHLHFDHTGNPLLFKNALFYASREEIDSLKTRFNFSNSQDLKKISIIPLGSKIGSLKIIKTPGHTIGSICLWKEDDKMLFTGDTLFRTGAIGRTDLPTSAKEKMQSSLMKLLKYDYKIIAPGHNLEHGKLL